MAGDRAGHANGAFHRRRAVGRPDHDIGVSILSDWRLAPAAPAANYVHSFITFLERIDKRGVRRWATVVKADSDASFEVGRTVETHADLAGLQYRVFRDYDAALMWLDSPRRP